MVNMVLCVEIVYLTNFIFLKQPICLKGAGASNVVYLVTSKTFGKVPNGRQLWKVRLHGIRGELANWIQNWSHDRKQRVTVEGFLSNWRPVTSGMLHEARHLEQTWFQVNYPSDETYNLVKDH